MIRIRTQFIVCRFWKWTSSNWYTCNHKFKNWSLCISFFSNFLTSTHVPPWTGALTIQAQWQCKRMNLRAASWRKRGSVTWSAPSEFTCCSLRASDWHLAAAINAPRLRPLFTAFFHFIQIEKHDNCVYDFVEIRDGADASAPLLGRFCGYQIPPGLKATNNQMYIRFMSDSSVQKQGFTGNFQKGEQNCAWKRNEGKKSKRER